MLVAIIRARSNDPFCSSGPANTRAGKKPTKSRTQTDATNPPVLGRRLPFIMAPLPIGTLKHGHRTWLHGVHALACSSSVAGGKLEHISSPPADQTAILIHRDFLEFFW